MGVLDAPGLSVATAVPALTRPPATALVTKGLYARTAPAPTGNTTGLRIMAKDPNFNGANGTGRIWGVGLGTSTLLLSDDDGATFTTKSGSFTDPVQGTDSIQGIYFSTNYVWILTTYNLWRFAKPSANGNPGGAGTDVLANLWNTTISSASNAAALPQSVVNIVNGNYLPTSGVATVETSAGPQLVTYTGKTAGTITGCSGGTGTMSTGGKVRAGYRVFGLSDLVNGPAGSTGAGGTNASFRNSCFAISSDEAHVFLCEYGALNTSVTLPSLTDGHIAKNSDKVSSDGGTFTASMVGKPVNISGATSGGTTLATTITEIIRNQTPAIARISTFAGTTVDNATISWPAQTYGSGVVIGGPSVYHSANPTAAPGSVAFTKVYTNLSAKHAHAMAIFGGLPWVSFGDMSAQFTGTGIVTASSITSPTAWTVRSASPAGTPAKDPINMLPVTISGQACVLCESDSSFRDGPLMFADQTGTVSRMVEATCRIPQPYSQTMRQLTIDATNGNIFWFGTGESGSVGPTSCIWMSRAPYTVPVLLEDVGTALDGETVPDGVLSNGYFWIGHYRCRVEKFLDQA